MVVNLSPIWGAGAQLFDNSGNVLSGGKIYTYAAGTTTPATTYTSSNGITANSNPIILNSAGRVPYEIWLSDTVAYKFVLKDSNDTLIATYDNLVGINSNYIAYTAQQEIQTATAGQTVFNLATMQYQPGTNNLSVFVDGVNQYGPGAQYAYVETDTDTVTFVSGLHVGASVKFTTASPVAGAVMNAENVAYDPPFTGAVGTNVEAKLAQTVSVKDVGAVGDGVTDDTTAFTEAESTTSSFIYLPSGTYVVNSIDLKKTYYGPGIIKLNGSNEPQLLSNSRPQTVTVFPPVTNASNVLLPDGTWLDVSTSTTSGLQEAIDYSCGDGTAGSGNLDLHIVGGEELGVSPGGAVLYTCTTPLRFPAMQGKNITSGAISINFTSAIGSQNAMDFDSCMMVNVNLAGCQIINGGTGIGLSFSPVNGVPLDGGLYGIKSIIDSKFHITTVVNTNNSTQPTSLGACVVFNPAAGGTGIQNSTFEFEEINQQNTAANTTGIHVVNSAANKVFVFNTIKCPHLHNWSGRGIQIGTSTAIASYAGNTWDVVLQSKAGASAGINTFGSYDKFFVSIEGDTMTDSVYLQPSATRNTFYSSLLFSPSRINNQATDKTSNQWIGAYEITNPTPITVGGSPYAYQNTTIRDQLVAVVGGTLTAVTQLSPDGTTYNSMGISNGTFYVPRGCYLKVTYSVAPTMFYYQL